MADQYHVDDRVAERAPANPSPYTNTKNTDESDFVTAGAGGPTTASSGNSSPMNADALMLPAEGPIGADHVNWLLKACGITQEDRVIDNLRQCSSSVFALLFQRIFNCTIPNLELEPNTQDKRLWNMRRVLEELQLFVSTDLSYIDAAQIVALNEEHISELIRVFFEIVVSFVMGAGGGGGSTTNNEGGPAVGSYGQHNVSGLSASQVGGLGAAGVGGGGDGDDVSQADSAHKTQRLVSNWKKEVVHPLHDHHHDGKHLRDGVAGKNKKGALRPKPLSDTVADLHNRLYHMDALLVTPTKVAGRSGGVPAGGARAAAARVAPGASNAPTSILKKTGAANVTGAAAHKRTPSAAAAQRGDPATVSSFHDPYSITSTSALFPPSTYSLAKTINTEARDIKTQQLKTMRFFTDLHQSMRSDVIRRASQEQTAIAGAVKGEQKRIRADTRDMLKYARDENERYKAAYECVLMSARNDINRFRAIVDPKTVQIYERNARATREAAAGVKAALLQQQVHEDRRVERYYSAITTWRKGTIACV